MKNSTLIMFKLLRGMILDEFYGVTLYDILNFHRNLCYRNIYLSGDLWDTILVQFELPSQLSPSYE